VTLTGEKSNPNRRAIRAPAPVLRRLRPCVVGDVGAGSLREPADGRFGELTMFCVCGAVEGPTKVMAGGISDSTVRRASTGE
jgi:hypothetical protein